MWFQTCPFTLRRCPGTAQSPMSCEHWSAPSAGRRSSRSRRRAWAVAKAGLADPKRPAGQRDADPLRRHRLRGQLPALSWPRHFFPRAFRSKSACMLRSANMRFSRRFSSSRVVRGSLGPVAFTAHSGSSWTHPCRHTRPATCETRRAADPVLAAQLGHGHPALRLAQHALDLGFGETALLHRNLLVHLAENFLPPHPLNHGEDYPVSSISI